MRTWVLGVRVHMSGVSAQVCPISPTLQSAVRRSIYTLSVLRLRPQLSVISLSINPTMHRVGEVYSH